MGFAGSFVVSDYFRVGALYLDGGVRPLLMLLMTALGAGLGLGLTAAARLPLRRALAFGAGGVLGAGFAGGALVGVVKWARYGPESGALSGLGCSIAFLPAVGALLLATRSIGRAREGSLVDGADRRAVWSAALVSIALGTAATMEGQSVFEDDPRTSLDIALGVGALALLGAAALWVKDVRGFWVARRAVIDRAVMRARNPDAPDPRGQQLDLGLGEETFERVAPGAGVYRETPFVIEVVRGDALAARRALERAVIRGAAGILIGAIVVGVAAHTAGDALFDGVKRRLCSGGIFASVCGMMSLSELA
jgi:hypothetical protein